MTKYRLILVPIGAVRPWMSLPSIRVLDSAPSEGGMWRRYEVATTNPAELESAIHRDDLVVEYEVAP